MFIQFVDLASVSWASCLGYRGEIGSRPYFEEFNSIQYPTESLAVSAITGPFRKNGIENHELVPDILIIEDLPHGVSYGEGLKNTARMQGRIIECMYELSYLDRVLFLQPMAWQAGLGVNKQKGMTDTEYVKFQIETARQLGYTPPNMVKEYDSMIVHLKGKERQAVRNKLKKVETDHVSAFLGYAWAVGKYKRDGTFDDIKAAQRYVR